MRSLLVLLLASVALHAESILPAKARVAILGDSITEQKLYSKYIETYLLACTGRTDIHVFQFGWSGERAGGFAARLVNDLAVFKPNVATICYGMNDGSYKPYTAEIGAEYEKNMRAVLAGLKQVGVKAIAVGSPGAVDPDFFNRPNVAGARYNENLAQLRDIARKLAGENGQAFANVHDTMLGALVKAKTVRGWEYAPLGADGFHPAAAGQLLMAEAFLKALGFDGDLGTITLDMKGRSTATEGHRVQPVKLPPGTVQVVSTRWPFCFDADPNSAGSTRSILPYTHFNEDLNRLTLKVANLESAKAKVRWGEQVREFSRDQLMVGINLVAEFERTPFDAAFAGLMNAVATKQAFETVLVKSLVTHMRGLAEEDPKVDAALAKLKQRLAAEHAKQDANVRKQLQPVTHLIRVEPLP
jgi:lysophospholipase L1-like esterase